MSTLSESFPLSPQQSRREELRAFTLFHDLARFILVATIFAAPWALGAVEPWAWASMMGLAFLALVLWTVGCVRRGTLRIAWTPMYWPFLALLLVALVQFFFGLTFDQVATREAILKLITNLVLFFLAGQLLNSRPENGRALEYLGMAVTGLTFALCVLALAQYFTGPDSRLIYWSIKVPPSSFGPFVNHNNFGGLMEMLIPVSVGYILTRPYDSLAPLLLWGVVIVAIVSVWISGSRAATAALLIEGLVFGAILLRQPMPEFRRRALPLLIGVVVIAVPVFTWMIGARMASNRAWSIFSSDRPLDATIGDRLWVGKSTLHMAASHPWIGVGVGCFELAFPTYASTPTDWHWTHAHDDYAEALAETGLPGAVILVTALVLFFRLAWRHLSDRLRHTAGWIQLGAAVGCVGLMAHSFVEFNLRVPSNGAWFVVCLAIAVHPRSSGVRARRLERFSPPDHAGDFLN